MSLANLNNKSPNDTSHIFLKCLSQFYQSEFEPDGDNLNYRRLKLRDAVVKAYNKQFKTKLKGFQLFDQLKQKEKSYQPYEWQKMFLEIFGDDYEATLRKNQVTSNANKSSGNLQNTKKKDNIDTINGKKETEKNVTTDEVFDNSTPSSCNAVISVECKIDIPIAVQEVDYKSMSNYELKRALLISKLEMLDAQEALKKAQENIRLTEEEHLKRKIDKQ